MKYLLALMLTMSCSTPAVTVRCNQQIQCSQEAMPEALATAPTVWVALQPGLEVPEGMWSPGWQAAIQDLHTTFNPGDTVRISPVDGLMENYSRHGDAWWSESDNCYYIRIDAGAFVIPTFAAIIIFHEWAHVTTWWLPDWITPHSDHHALMLGAIYRHMIAE